MEINHLLLVRHTFKVDLTLGTLYLPGRYEATPFCETIEDACRVVKIPDESAIGAGTYKIVVTKSPKFGRKMPLLLDVPEYSGIRIHYGKNEGWTSGCVLVQNKARFEALGKKLEGWVDPTWLTIVNIPGGFR